MIKKERIRLIVVLAMLGLLTVFCANFNAEDPSANPISAMLSEFSGKVQVMKATKGVFEAASQDFYLEENDQVLTGEDGRARIDISDGTIIRLSPLSNFVLTSMEDTNEGTFTRLQLNIGRLWIILKGGVVEVDTPSGLASVRGSYLHVWVDPLSEETNVTCLEGQCSLANDKGTVSLVAGQTAKITGKAKAPEAGKMTHDDVEQWLDANPEATLVVVPLTATVAANEDKATPAPKTNTPTPTATIGPSPTTGPTKTPTNTVEAVGCGPEEGWVLHTIREGETLESLAALYRVSVEALRTANCRGDMDFVVAGEKFYVPNVATSTPTKTPTSTPLASKTPVSTSGSGGTGTDSPTTMSDPVGPDNDIIDTTAECGKPYKIKVVDADGIQDVKMIYTFDGSLPMRDTAISENKYKILPLISDNVYGVSGYVIDTTGQTIPVKIRFRFAAHDKNGVVTYFPKDDAYDLTDKVNCSNNTPATLNNESGPNGTTITVVGSCSQTYQVDVVDPDGIDWVKMVYTTDGSVPTYGSGTTKYHLMSKVSGDTFRVTEVVDTSGGPTVVNYRFAVSDVNGNKVHYPATPYSFTDNIDCGTTMWVTGIGPTGTIATCANDYQIFDVTDANGISEVKLYYTITDTGPLSPKTAYLLLTRSAGDAIKGDYSINSSIDLVTDGYQAGSTIDWEFRALDTRGIWTSMTTGSFTDPIVCGP